MTWGFVDVDGVGTTFSSVPPDGLFLALSNAGATIGPPLPTKEDVDRERDRRIDGGFTFAGKVYDSDSDSRASIAGAMSQALAAVTAGAQTGDLRWMHPDKDFGWIAADNSITPMDATTCLAFARSAAAWYERLIFKARGLKDKSPIPMDFKDDKHW